MPFDPKEALRRKIALDKALAAVEEEVASFRASLMTPHAKLIATVEADRPELEKVVRRGPVEADGWRATWISEKVRWQPKYKSICEAQISAPFLDEEDQRRMLEMLVILKEDREFQSRNAIPARMEICHAD